MTSKYPSEAVDDFTQISGIGENIQRRFHEADIFSFDQFVDKSPDDIARLLEGVRGITTEKIEEWIHKAGELAAESAPAEPQPPSEEPTVPSAPIAKSTPPPTTPGRIAGPPRLRELKIVPVGTERPSTLIHHDRPFDVRLHLDMTEVTGPTTDPISYKATIYVKNLSNGQRQVVSETQGTIISTDTLVVNVPGGMLTPDAYRLEAMIGLTLTPGVPELPLLKDTLLQVY